MLPSVCLCLFVSFLHCLPRLSVCLLPPLLVPLSLFCLLACLFNFVVVLDVVDNVGWLVGLVFEHSTVSEVMMR